MASGFFMLLDDIASVLDDVATLTKVAVKKTSGVLGDDLALNAQQVTGVQANRELPIVWAVAKGSAINKVILVPAALLLSIYLPSLIDPLMILGGGFLCYEGVEKLLHKFLHSHEEVESHQKSHKEALATPEVDIVAAEKSKVAGAIRTDFILSAEIIVISLDVVTESSSLVKFLVLSTIGVLMTIGVYGLVAGIVKLDDLGIYWKRSAQPGLRSLGNGILWTAPYLMKFLSVAGTLAMFLVGGGILVHKIHWVHQLVEHLDNAMENLSGWIRSPVLIVAEGIVGVIAGALVVAVLAIGKRVVFGKPANTAASSSASSDHGS
jgi:predicted DNA repair protein MutK